MRIILFCILLASCGYAINGPFDYNTISSDYGPRNISYGSLFHKGIDYGQSGGTAIPAVEAGDIKEIKYVGGYGYRVEVEAVDGNVWWYCHMEEQCSSINTEFYNVTLVDTHNVNITKNALVLIFWHDKSKYIAEKVLTAEDNPYYIKYNRRYVKLADTTRNCITQNNVSSREIIGPVGKSGGNYPYHLHLGLAREGQNPLLLIDHNHVSPSLNNDIQQPKDGATVYRKKYYPIKIGVNNTQNKDLDSVSIQLDNNTPKKYYYGGATVPDDNNIKVVFFDTTGVWPDPGMGNDRFIYCVDLSNDTLGLHVIKFSAHTIKGQKLEKTINFSLAGGFFVSCHEPLNGKTDVSPFLQKVSIVFSEPLDTATLNQGSVMFNPVLAKPFSKVYSTGNKKVDLILTDTCQSLRYSTKYEITLKGDAILDTAGIKLDGNDDQVPGGDYKFAFYTKKPQFEVNGCSRKVARGQTINLHGIVQNKEKVKLKYRFRHKGLNEYVINGMRMTLNGFCQDTGGTFIRDVEVNGNRKDSFDIITVVATNRAKPCASKEIPFQVEVRDSIGYLNVTKECRLSVTVVTSEGGGGGGGPGAAGDQGIVVHGGDDNWSISDPHYPSPWLIDDAAEVGLLLEGFSESCGHLLGRYGIATVPVESESLLVLSNYDRRLEDLKVLVIPTNGLRDLASQPYFWQRIEEYVSNGGYLVVLDQPFGSLYARLPGSPQGRGFEEDLSCNGWFTRLYDGQPVTAHSKYKMANNPTDGYFTYMPTGSQIHATRIMRGGAASTITYPYGQGRVFATTCYIDQAWGAGQWSFNAGRMLRDAITCGFFPEWTFEGPEYQNIKPGESGEISILLKNPPEPDSLRAACDRAVVSVYDPNRRQTQEHTFVLSPPLMPGDTTCVSLPFTAPVHDTFRGLWLSGYRLYADTVLSCSLKAAKVFSVSDTMHWNGSAWQRYAKSFYINMYRHKTDYVRGDTLKYTLVCGNAGMDSVTVGVKLFVPGGPLSPSILLDTFPHFYLGPADETELVWNYLARSASPYTAFSMYRVRDGKILCADVYGSTPVYQPRISGTIKAVTDSNWRVGDYISLIDSIVANFTGSVLRSLSVNSEVHKCTLFVENGRHQAFKDSILIGAQWKPGFYSYNIKYERLLLDSLETKINCNYLYGSFSLSSYRLQASLQPDSSIAECDTLRLGIRLSPPRKATGTATLSYNVIRHYPHIGDRAIFQGMAVYDSLKDGMVLEMPWQLADSLRFGLNNKIDYRLIWDYDSLRGIQTFKSPHNMKFSVDHSPRTLVGWGDTVVYSIKVKNNTNMNWTSLPLVWSHDVSSLLAQLDNAESQIWHDSTCLIDLPPGADTTIVLWRSVDSFTQPESLKLGAALLFKPERLFSMTSPNLDFPSLEVATDTGVYSCGETVRLHLYNSSRTGTQASVEELKIEDPQGNWIEIPAWSGFLGPMSDTVICEYQVPALALGGYYTYKGALQYIFGTDTLRNAIIQRILFQGYDATVTLSTSKDIYFPPDSIGLRAAINNTGVLPLDHQLGLEIKKYGLEPVEFFFIPDSSSAWWNRWPVPNPDCAPGCTLDASGVRLLGYDRLYSQGGIWSWWGGDKWAKKSYGKLNTFALFKMEKARRQAKDNSGPKAELVQDLRLTGHQGRPWALMTTNQRTFLIGPLPNLQDSVDVSGLGRITGLCSDGLSFYLSSLDSCRVFKVSSTSGTVQASWPVGDPAGCALSGGRLYAADRAGGLVRAFSPQGESLFVFGSGRLNLPREVLALDDGSLLVADMDSLKRFTAEGASLPALAQGIFSKLAQGGDYIYAIEPDSMSLRKYDLSGALVETQCMAPWDIACVAETLYTGNISGGGAWAEGEAYVNYGKWKGRTSIFAESEVGFLDGAKYITSFRPQVTGPGSVDWRLRIGYWDYGLTELSCDSLEGFDLEAAQSGGRPLSFSAMLVSPDGHSTPSVSRLDITALSLLINSNDPALWSDDITVNLAAGDSLLWQGTTPSLDDSGDFYLEGRMQLGPDQYLPGIARHRFSVSSWPLMAELKTQHQDYWPGEEIKAFAIVHNRTDSAVQNVNLSVKKGPTVIADTIIPSIPAQATCSLAVAFTDTIDFLMQAKVSAYGYPDAKTQKSINVERPYCYFYLTCPDSAGTRPFSANLEIHNDWTRPVAFNLNWSWSEASVAETLTVLPGTQRMVSQQVWITDDDTLRISVPWGLEEELVRPIAFNCRARVVTDTIVTSGSGAVGLDYRILNQGALLSSLLNITLCDTSGAVLDSLSKTYQLAPGDTVMDMWQAAPGCGRFRLSWALLADSSTVVLDSASALVEVVPSGTVRLDSLTLDSRCDSLGRAWVGLYARNLSAEPFAGSFMVESDAGYWRSDLTLDPQSATVLRYSIGDPQESGARTFRAACLSSGDTVAVLSRLLRFKPEILVDSLPDTLETAIGDTVEFNISLVNLGNAISRDTVIVNLGDLTQRETELALVPNARHTEQCLALVPDDLEEQTVLGFASVAGRFYPITAHISGYRINVAASLDRSYYRAGDTVRLEVTASNRTQRNLACLMSGVYREEEARDAFLLLGGSHRIGFDSNQRVYALSDSAWYVSGLVDPGQFDSLSASCQLAVKKRREFVEDGGRSVSINIRHLAEDSVSAGPWAERLDAGRFVQFRLRLEPGDTVERVLLTKYVAGVPLDTLIETFDSLHVRRTCAWAFDPGQGTQSLLSYGIHTRTGRSLWLNTAYVYGGTDSLALWPDKQVYNPGDTVRITASTTVGGLFKYDIDLPPVPQVLDSIQMQPGDTTILLALPPEQTAGTRYFGYVLAVGGDTSQLLSGYLRFDVSGFRIRVHDCRLSSPSWRPGDSLTAWFRLHSSHQMNISRTTQVHGPGGSSGPAETTTVSLAQGYNWMEFSRRIPEGFGPGRGALELGFHRPGLDFGSQSFGFTVICPDTNLPSAWFVQCPASTYESQLPYAVLLHSEDDRMASDTLYYHAGTGWIGLLPERKENAVSEFLIPPQPRGTAVAYYASVSDGAGNRARAPEIGYLTFHVLPALAPGEVATEALGDTVEVAWGPPSGELAYHQYNPYISVSMPAAVRYSSPYLPARVASLTAWLERPDSTQLAVDFLDLDANGQPGQPLHPRFSLVSADTAPGWTTWPLDTMGLELAGDFYLGLEAAGRPLFADGSPGAYRTLVNSGQGWISTPEMGELCVHLGLRYPQATVLYQVHRAKADSSYLMLADSLLSAGYRDTTAGPEGRYRYLVKGLWTVPGLYASSPPVPLTVDRLAPRFGDSLTVVFGDSTAVIGVLVWDGIGVAADSINAPSGFTTCSDSLSAGLRWYTMPTVAVGDTAVFCFYAWDSAGNVGRSPESDWHRVANTGINGGPGGGLPTCFGLAKSFPNPARGSCTIKYQLPKPTPVLLSIYNLAGQRVRVLDEGLKQPGYYQVRWNGRDEAGRRTANGVYFYRLTAEGYQKTERLVVVR